MGSGMAKCIQQDVNITYEYKDVHVVKRSQQNRPLTAPELGHGNRSSNECLMPQFFSRYRPDRPSGRYVSQAVRIKFEYLNKHRWTHLTDQQMRSQTSALWAESSVIIDIQEINLHALLDSRRRVVGIRLSGAKVWEMLMIRRMISSAIFGKELKTTLSISAVVLLHYMPNTNQTHSKAQQTCFEQNTSDSANSAVFFYYCITSHSIIERVVLTSPLQRGNYVHILDERSFLYSPWALSVVYVITWLQQCTIACLNIPALFFHRGIHRFSYSL